MKPFILLASCFTFAVAQVTTADDGAPKSSATTQRVARPNAGQSRTASQPNWNVRRAPPVFPRQTNLTSLSMNIPRPLRNSQTGRVPDASPRRAVASGSSDRFQGANNNRRSFFEALRRCRHERHDCNWWRQHFTTIVFVNYGYYYCDAGYWYPALGYDPANDYYEYDGPIYSYGNLLPDQVIANVQSALQEEGYYLGPVTGLLDPATRAAIGNYQTDLGLIVTEAIDEPTIESLGLN